MRDYTKIEAWRLADDLTVAVYERTRCFPREEIYGLTSQLRRAAYSVPANIVEGSSRKGRREFRRFLDISVASLSELEYALEVANALGYVAAEAYAALEVQQRRTRYMAWKLHGSLRDAGP